MRTFLPFMCIAALPAQEGMPLSPLAIARLLPPLTEELKPPTVYPPALPPLPKGKWLQVVATGYSPHDQLDSAYHATKGAWRWKTATLTDVRTRPYGIAVPFTQIQKGAAVFVPPGSGYVSADNHIFMADDTGSDIRANTQSTGIPHIDLRFRTESSARKFGRKNLWVFVYHDGYEQVRKQTVSGRLDRPER